MPSVVAASNTQKFAAYTNSNGNPAYHRSIWIGGGGAFSRLLVDCGRDDTDGNPSPPCQTQPRPGVLKDIWWPISASGTYSFSIDVKHGGSPSRPRLVVKADPILGVNADVTQTAPTGTDWVTITVTVTVSGPGVLHVWRERMETDLTYPCKWDNIPTPT